MSSLDIAIVVCILFWAGFVSSISFMEAWLKFRAPGVTLRTGLSIGRLIFSALNKVECVLALLISVLLFIKGDIARHTWVYSVPLVLLLIQTLFLLPALDARTNAILSDQLVPPSRIHFYFVIAETGKVIALIVFAVLHCTA